ncbi:MAG: IS3 family transposase [Gaiellaceae bacterium]
MRREVVNYMKSRGLSERRACAYAALQRSTCRYKSKRDPQTKLVTRMRELASERPRFGYRRIHVLLRREKDWQTVNRKRVQRLYREEGLAVRRRTRKKLRQARPAPLMLPSRANERWAMDFVHDYLTDGRKLRTLNIVDTCTRECLAIEVDLSLTGERVTRVLDAVLWQYGLPRAITVDNGPEFISNALDRWAHQHGVELHFIQPGKPTQNAHVESFNSRFRDEFLSQGRWPTVARARFEVARYRDDYNDVRPHSALGYRTPAAFGVLARTTLIAPAGGLSGKAPEDRLEAPSGLNRIRSEKIKVQFNAAESFT